MGSQILLSVHFFLTKQHSFAVLLKGIAVAGVRHVRFVILSCCTVLAGPGQFAPAWGTAVGSPNRVAKPIAGL